MSDTRRKHLQPKSYRSRRPERVEQTKDGSKLKTTKQQRAAGRRAWRKELT